MTARCAAWIVSAPASGQGKTTVTAALARRFRNDGRRVRVFKTGPDFIDPMILAQASGHPVHTLDRWLGGDDHCGTLLHDAASNADIILVEGVMGLYDGAPSTADLAAHFAIPVLAVVDGSAMAQTFGAIVHGLRSYRDDIRLDGVIANRVAGERHYRMLSESLPPGVSAHGYLARDADIAWPERHLGLVQAGEISDLDDRIERAARALGHVAPPAPVAFEAIKTDVAPPLLRGVRIAVARDTAFSFIYPANLDTLHRLGAELSFFSPVAHDALPICDAVYLPGGYPELHLDALSRNRTLAAALHAHVRADKPIVAECGGMLFLLDTLTDVDGHTAPMLGILPGRAAMQPLLSALALQEVVLPEGTLRAHTFHYSTAAIDAVSVARARCPNGSATSEAVYRTRRVTASYLHFYFASNPQATARMFMP